MTMTVPTRKIAANPRLTCVAAVCTAAWMLAACAPASAQEERTGVSHPDSSVITIDSPESVVITSDHKPSAAIPAAKPEVVYGPYVPYHAPGSPAPAAIASGGTFDADASIVTAETAGRRPLTAAELNPGDPDAGIVTHVPSRAGEIPDGTLLKVRLGQELSTLKTSPGTVFTARVSEPVMHEGIVVIPANSVLEGRVTWVRGGKRIGGAAAIHLEPRTVTLPDGGQYTVHAQVIDTDNWDNTKVDDEGTILRRDHGKQTLAAMSLAAGGPMAAGAVIGGVPGALIGAGVGAGVSTVIWLKQDRQTALPKDLGIVFSLTEPMSTTPTGAAMSGLPATATTGGE